MSPTTLYWQLNVGDRINFLVTILDILVLRSLDVYAEKLMIGDKKVKICHQDLNIVTYIFCLKHRCSQKIGRYENFKIPFDPYGANFRPQIGHVQIFSFADCNFLSF